MAKTQKSLKAVRLTAESEALLSDYLARIAGDGLFGKPTRQSIVNFAIKQFITKSLVGIERITHAQKPERTARS